MTEDCLDDNCSGGQQHPVEVWIDESDLTLIDEAARRDGVDTAELIRDAIHRTAMSHQFWMKR